MSSSERTPQPTRYYPRRSDVPEEAKRLDDLHEGIKKYLGGALTTASLGNATPKTVLDMGAGTGAWAIQAATQFPDAEVLAVDISPLPPRDIPPNLKYQTLDLTEPCPFGPETFDIVHARFVLVHLPEFETILSTIIQLVRPGGWLLLEDVENFIHNDGERSPEVKTAYDTFLRVRRSKGVDPFAGSALEGLLKASGAFKEVDVKKVVLPLSGKDFEGNDLAAAIKTSLQRTFKGMAQRPEVFEMSTKDVMLLHDEMDDPNSDLHFNVYFIGCRKP